MARRRRSGDRCTPGPATTRPPMEMEPPVNRSMPAWQRSRVVLPEPDGPSKTRKVPGSMWRWTSERAGLVPKDLVTPTTSTLSPSPDIFP